MRAITHSTETVEGGDAESARKTSVRAASCSALPQRKVHLFCKKLGTGEQRRTDFAFERRAVKAARDLQFCSFVNRPQRTKAALDAAHVGRPHGAQIEHGASALRNHIRARAALDNVGVDADATAGIVPQFDARKLRSQFVYGI